MYCPQCGTDSSSGQQYCRSCGANLKVIGKAVSLSEAIARTDRGPLPKIKEMMKSLKIEQVSDEISRALDQMNQEIVKNSGSLAAKARRLERQDERVSRRQKKEKTAQQRREAQVTRGLISFFGGIGFMTFLYFLSSALVLKLPANVIVEAPFEIQPVVHMIWLIGLIPTLSGLGRIMAGLIIRPESGSLAAAPETESRVLSTPPKPSETNERAPRYEPPSVTERTTNILNRGR